jgi:hypothetical protein
MTYSYLLFHERLSTPDYFLVCSVSNEGGKKGKLIKRNITVLVMITVSDPILKVSLIADQITAAVSHTKPASLSTCRINCDAELRDRRCAVYVFIYFLMVCISQHVRPELDSSLLEERI